MLKYYGFIIPILLFLTACGTKKKMVYLQGEEKIAESPSTYIPTFKPDDYISVIVNADDPETAVPFNFPQEVIGKGQQMMGGNMMLGMPINNGYLVDDEGFIDLPVVGRMHVGGLTRKELVVQLKEKYNAYLENPIVNVKIQNFKISVLGDVRSPGTYIVPNERITLMEAISLAGDLNITGERNNVLVIREKNNQREEFRVDLTNKEFFNSPVYYLEQNDVVYIEPNVAARVQGTFWRTTGPVLLSITSFAITTILLLTNN
jgi:polysaccharide export outer membrane protein